MKNKTISFCLVALAILSIFPVVSATSYFGNTVGTLNLQEKNPSDWSVVENGAHGIIKLTTVSTPWKIVQQRASVMVYDLIPKTEYQLIYYGNNEFNDVWPYATCIGVPRRTSTQGFFSSGSSVVNHLDMANDDIAQKFWVVLASDVDCDQGKMIAWNPTEYLFEEHTI